MSSRVVPIASSPSALSDTTPEVIVTIGEETHFSSNNTAAVGAEASVGNVSDQYPEHALYSPRPAGPCMRRRARDSREVLLQRMESRAERRRRAQAARASVRTARGRRISTKPATADIAARKPEVSAGRSAPVTSDGHDNESMRRVFALATARGVSTTHLRGISTNRDRGEAADAVGNRRATSIAPQTARSASCNTSAGGRDHVCFNASEYTRQHLQRPPTREERIAELRSELRKLRLGGKRRRGRKQVRAQLQAEAQACALGQAPTSAQAGAAFIDSSVVATQGYTQRFERRNLRRVLQNELTRLERGLSMPAAASLRAFDLQQSAEPVVDSAGMKISVAPHEQPAEALAQTPSGSCVVTTFDGGGIGTSVETDTDTNDDGTCRPPLAFGFGPGAERRIAQAQAQAAARTDAVDTAADAAEADASAHPPTDKPKGTSNGTDPFQGSSSTNTVLTTAAEMHSRIAARRAAMESELARLARTDNAWDEPVGSIGAACDAVASIDAHDRGSGIGRRSRHLRVADSVVDSEVLTPGYPQRYGRDALRTVLLRELGKAKKIEARHQAAAGRAQAAPRTSTASTKDDIGFSPTATLL